MTHPPHAAPAGWYPVAQGGQRFWNGIEWTADVIGAPNAHAEYAALAPDLSAPTAPPAAQPAAQPTTAPAAAASAANPAPGWYPNASGIAQWWDGYTWGPIARPAKDIGTAYLFAILLGGFGAHRFYLGEIGSAIGMLAAWCVGVFLIPFLIGIPILIGATVWWIIDLCILPSMVRTANTIPLAPAAR